MKKLFTLFVSLWIAMASLFAVNMTGGEVFYLKPNSNWIQSNARFAIYLCNGSSGEKWVSMTKVTGETNLYSVTIPTGDYKNLIFVRLNPANSTNNWGNKWNQTGDLSYDGKNNCCSINSGQWDCGMNVKWSFYSTEPVITVVTSPEFPATTIEETATATLKYTVDNSEEKATITIDNDAFTAVDNNGTVTITFAPTEAKEYTATITIAVGEVKETVEISATGLAKDVVKDPEVLNLTAPEFAEIIEGNTTTAVATYELLNAEEAEAKVEGEGFEITEQELEKVTIKFAPTKAGEYTGTLLILVAGETLKEVAFTATAKPAPYYAIRGDMTDWSDKKDIKLTPNDDKSEYFIKGFEIASGKKFKVVYVNEDNATSWYGTDKVQLEAGISNSGQGDGDIALTPAGKYDIYYKVKEGKIWIQKYVEPTPDPEPDPTPDPEPDPTPDPEPDPDPVPDPDNTITFTVQVPEGTKECYIAGTPAWTFIQMEKVEGEENLYTLTVENTVLDGEKWKYASGADWSFVEKTAEGGDVADRTGAENPDVVAKWAIVYDPDAEPIDPYYAIRGSMTNWAPENDIKLTENAEGTEWFITSLEVAEGDEFKVVYIDENLSATWYGAGAVEANEALGEFGEGEENIKLAAGKYDIYFKVDSKTMWIQPASPSTDAEEAVAELIYAAEGTIYAPAPFAIIDLAGKDVTKANGALEGSYIVKTQNSVTKVLVK